MQHFGATVYSEGKGEKASISFCIFTLVFGATLAQAREVQEVFNIYILL
jgi:hypothetical protein